METKHKPQDASVTKNNEIIVPCFSISPLNLQVVPENEVNVNSIYDFCQNSHKLLKLMTEKGKTFNESDPYNDWGKIEETKNIFFLKAFVGLINFENYMNPTTYSKFFTNTLKCKLFTLRGKWIFLLVLWKKTFDKAITWFQN